MGSGFSFKIELPEKHLRAMKKKSLWLPFLEHVGQAVVLTHMALSKPEQAEFRKRLASQAARVERRLKKPTKK